jgi:hypothetical protein
MRQKRIPLRIVFLAVAVVSIATGLFLQYAISGEPFYSLSNPDENRPPAEGSDPEIGKPGTDGSVSDASETTSRITDDGNHPGNIPAQDIQAPSTQETPTFQVVQLVIPDLNLDASAGSVSLVPWQEGESIAGEQAAFLVNSTGQNIMSDSAGLAGRSAVDDQELVDLDAIREMLGLGSDAQFTIYDLSGDFFSNAAQMDSSGEMQQPIIIRLDNARWIVPQSSGSFQIDTSWQDELGLRRFIIVAKPPKQATDADTVN